ncbi:MAG: AAA family ATPase, partial [Cyclobacteriaceae bacterium]|nr:AAA family ATPase [Cyclobacteriaceae bacterium]
PIRSRLEISAVSGLSPYVGRDQELALLNSCYSWAEKGKGQLVMISGEAGIGKSRMLLEFQQMNKKRQLRWLQGSCMANGQNIPYLPIIDLLKKNFGIKEAESDEDIIEHIDERISKWDKSVLYTIPYLKYLLSVDSVDDSVKSMDAMERRAHIFDGLRAMLINESNHQPLIIVIEDLHWADEQSEAILDVLSEAIVASKVLLILTNRPEHRYAFIDHSHHHKINLSQLTAESSEKMITGILKTSEIPVQLQQLIIKKAEGNPFFIEEVTKSLVETGVIQKSNDTYTLQCSLDQIQIPDTIQDIILSRIDRLEEKAKEALQLASVIGREFTVRLLNRISDVETSLDNMLDELKVLELIFQKDFFPELSYMFKHALTHDVAYFTLLKDRRKRLHQTIGIAIEELYADRIYEHYEMLSYHFYEGEDWEKAIEYLMKSAQKASNAFTNHDAIQFYSRALEVCKKSANKYLRESVEILQLRGMSNYTIGNFPAAISDFKDMNKFATKLGDRHLEGVALAFQAWMECWNHDIEIGEITAKSALQIAKEGYDDVRFFASSTLGVMYYGINRIDEAEPYLQDAKKLAHKASNLLSISWWSIVGWHQLQWESRFEETLSHLTEHRQSLEDTKSIFLIMGDRWLEALPRASKGEYSRALQLLDEVITTSDRVGGVPFWHTRTLNTIGWIYGELQDFEQAIKWNTEGIEKAIKANFIDPEVESNARLNLGDNLMEIGKIEEAEKQFQIVEKIVSNDKPEERLDLWRYSQHLFHSYGELWLIRNEFGKAMDYANKCLTIASQGKSNKNIVKARRLRGQVFIKKGEIESAENEIKIALELAKKVGN